MATLDVRADIASGAEPFGKIMAAVGRLAADEPLVIVAPFEPRPLYAAMAARGFAAETTRLPDGAWRVAFTRNPAKTGGSQAETPPERYGPAEWSRHRFYRPFVRAALVVALTFGFTTGAGMLLIPALGFPMGTWWVPHAQAHGVAQIFGWTGLFLMGVGFHVLPRLRAGSIQVAWPQRATLLLVLLGVTLRFLGQSLHAHWPGQAMLAASGPALLGGMLTFAYAAVGALRSGTSPRTLTDAWLWAALSWGTVAALVHLGIVADMARTGAAAAPSDWNRVFQHVALFGFLGAFVLGIAAHAVPGFLGLRAPERRAGVAALVLLNAGVLAHVAGILGGWRAVAGLGEIGEGLALLAFIASLRPFGRTPPRPAAPGTYVRFAWFVRAAFGWLAVAGLLLTVEGLERAGAPSIFPAMVAAPVLHVYVLGFLTMLIMGMGTRMLPLFQRTTLRGGRAMDVAFVCLNASVALRVVFGLWLTEATPRMLGVSGLLGLAALCVFAWVIWRVLGATPAAAPPGARQGSRVPLSVQGPRTPVR